MWHWKSKSCKSMWKHSNNKWSISVYSHVDWQLACMIWIWSHMKVVESKLVFPLGNMSLCLMSHTLCFITNNRCGDAYDSHFLKIHIKFKKIIIIICFSFQNINEICVFPLFTCIIWFTIFFRVWLRPQNFNISLFIYKQSIIVLLSLILFIYVHFN